MRRAMICCLRMSHRTVRGLTWSRPATSSTVSSRLASGFIVCVFASFRWLVWCQGGINGESPMRLPGTCHVSRRERQLSAGCGRVVAGSGVGPGLEDKDLGVIERTAPGVAFASGAVADGGSRSARRGAGRR